MGSIAYKVTKLGNFLHEKLSKKATLESMLLSNKNRVAEIDKQSDDLSKASLFLQTLSDSSRNAILGKISAIVTDVLKKVKDKDLAFQMTLSTERNQLELNFSVVDEATGQTFDILNSCGGGIADLVAFALRVSLLLKWNPSLSRVLVLDETFKFVSVKDQELLAEFVKQLSEKLNLQIILVTHSQTLGNAAHRVFQISQNNKQSEIEVRL